MTASHFAAIAGGGALGALSRFYLSSAMQRWYGQPFPLGTLSVNLLGAFVIGFLGGIILPRQGDSLLAFFLITGFLGSFTTFSTFSMELLRLWQSGYTAGFFWYLISSNVGALLLAWLGYVLADQAGKAL